jgi:hypothetical protein
MRFGSTRLTVSSFGALALAALFCPRTATMPLFAQPPASATGPTTPRVKWAEIPLSFEPNAGQESREVRYVARGSSSTLYFIDAEMLLTAGDQPPLKMTFTRANPAARITGEAQQSSVSNLPPGTYDIAVFAFSTPADDFTPAKVVRVVVR